jgi:hypothetical protein
MQSELGFGRMLALSACPEAFEGRRSLQEKSFESKLNYMLATYYLRDLNFQEQRGRCNFTIPALGETFKVLFG